MFENRSHSWYSLLWMSDERQVDGPIHANPHILFVPVLWRTKCEGGERFTAEIGLAGSE